jgi:hypothetical protein
MVLWILLLLALVAILINVREGFNPATERPSSTDQSLRKSIEAFAGTTDYTIVENYIMSIQSFYDKVYLPKKETPTSEQVKAFVDGETLQAGMTKDVLTRAIDYVFLTTEPQPQAQTQSEGITDAKCPDGNSPPITDFKCPSTGARPTCPTGSSLYMVSGQGTAPQLKCVPSQLVYDGAWTDGERTQNPCRSSSDLAGRFIPASGEPLLEMPKCIATSGSTNTTGSTGGSSNILGATTPAPSSKGKNIFGPTFAGFGTVADPKNSTDTSKTLEYPQLLGGGDFKPSTRIDGVGIVAPSLNSSTQGLPSSKSLGTDENAKFFPHSRTPGDMDLIPDPYRVSSTFTTSSYSSKTEPVPFLTDFSAFLR